MSVKIVDQEVVSALRQIGADSSGDFLKELFLIFEQQSQDLTVELRNAIERNNSAEVVNIAHKFKGSSKCVGALYLAELCRRVQDEADSEYPNFGELRSLVEEIEVIAQRSRVEIQDLFKS